MKQNVWKADAKSLELNKYGSKGTYLNLTVFDLNQLIKRTILMFEGRCKEKRLSFDLILTGDELYVKADSAKIDQVMHNLIDNALNSAMQIPRCTSYVRLSIDRCTATYV